MWWPFRRKGVDLNKIKLPDAPWIDAAKARVSLTPDFHILQNRYAFPLFVYDGLMKGYTTYHKQFLEPFLVTGPVTAWTKLPFHLFKQREGDIPFMIEKQFTSSPCHKVKGQLYYLDPEAVFEIDKLMENGVKFVRARTDLLIPYRMIRSWRTTASSPLTRKLSGPGLTSVSWTIGFHSWMVV